MRKIITILLVAMSVVANAAVPTANYCHKRLTQDGYYIFLTAEQSGANTYILTVESPFTISRFTEGVYCYTDALHEGTGTQVNTLTPVLSTDCHTLTLTIPASAAPYFFTPLYVQFGMREVNFGDIKDIVWGECGGYQEDQQEPLIDQTGGTETDAAVPYCGKTLSKGPYSVQVTGKTLGGNQYQMIIESEYKMERLSSNSYIRLNGDPVQLETLNPVRSADWKTFTVNLSSTTTPCFYTPLCIEMPDEVNFGYIANIEWTTCEQSALYETSFPSGEDRGEARKLLIDGHLYIYRDGQLFTILGYGN